MPNYEIRILSMALNNNFYSRLGNIFFNVRVKEEKNLTNTAEWETEKYILKNCPETVCFLWDWIYNNPLIV